MKLQKNIIFIFFSFFYRYIFIDYCQVFLLDTFFVLAVSSIFTLQVNYIYLYRVGLICKFSTGFSTTQENFPLFTQVFPQDYKSILFLPFLLYFPIL